MAKARKAGTITAARANEVLQQAHRELAAISAGRRRKRKIEAT